MKTTFSATELQPGFGLRVSDLDLNLIDDYTFGRLYQAWLDYHVLVLPGQELSTDQQIAFARRFGDLQHAKPDPNKSELDYVIYVTNQDVGSQRRTQYPDGELTFHFDQCYIERPSQATFLYGMTIPSKGGQTLFSSATRAYRALPAETKERIKDLHALHDSSTNDEFQHVHPLVVRHPETGKSVLYACRLNTRSIIELPADDSKQLLHSFWDYLEDPTFVYTHNWTPGDLVLWDNRCVLHARTDFSPTEARMLRRVTVVGEGLVAASSEA